MSDWQWRRPKSHLTQPLVEWWAEQVAVLIMLHVAKRSHRRGDTPTFNRAFAIVKAGARAEEST